MTETENAGEESGSGVDERTLRETGEPEGRQAAVPFDAAYDRRRRRIFDHRVEALDEPNTLIGCLAGVNSDLLDMELMIAETLRQGLSENGGSLETIERHAGLIDLQLRYSKQIAQLTQLEQRSRKNGGETTSSKPHGT